MNETTKDRDISSYIQSKEAVANKYVIHCFGVIMLVFLIAYLLNAVGIFIIDEKLMLRSFIPSCIIYFSVGTIAKIMNPNHPALKYIILAGVVMMFTTAGIFLTYHVRLIFILMFLYATLYSSKRVMWYACVLMVISTFVSVYAGYYYGLCDANMVLLTSTTLDAYNVDGTFALNTINKDPNTTLFIFFVLPRCLIYIAFVSVCNNINHILTGSLERARLSEELEKAKIKAENATLAKSKFLARMSHEIRTPINAVISMDEMILRESKEEHITNYARDIKSSSLHLLSLINDILDSSKIESGMMELVPVDYSVGRVFKDLYNMFVARANEKNLTLTFEIDEAIPKKLRGDDKRIRQILMNLLSNAIKYTRQGKVTFKVSCDVDNEDAVLHFTVKDTGLGIKKEDISRIYDEFQRLDTTKNRNVEGTGLGMSIVQQLLGLMDSHLQIESEYGEGSSFSFSLRQTIVDSTPLGSLQDKLQSTGDEIYRSNYMAPEAKILVVDDYEMNLKVFKGLLKPTKMQIFTAHSGEECLELLKSNTYDLIFLDHMMPGMDGIETLHEIKKLNLAPGIPIVMLTANAIVGDRDKYIAEGFDDFLSKPIDVQKLDKKLLKYLPENLILPLSEDIIPDKAETICEKSIDYKEIFEALQKQLLEIDFESGLAMCCGDYGFYMELFRDYTGLAIKEELMDYYKKNDFKNYSIRIHGFKNTSNSIGAKVPGKLAQELESLTKVKFPENILELQEAILEKYEHICTRYKAIMKE